MRRNFARFLSICAVLGCVTLAHAQSYSIDWHTIGGGGGTSTGGVYSLNGTIGQPAAGSMSGDGYTLDGGSWGGAAGIPAGFGENLILNPGAEAGASSVSFNDVVPVPYWTTVGNFTVFAYDATVPSPGPAFRTNVFAGGPDNPHSTASQTLEVSAVAAAIDSATVRAELSGFFGGFGPQDDRASLTATYLGATGNPLGSFSIGSVLAADRANVTTLVYRGNTNTVPTGTRKIELLLSMTRDAGTYNDGYADNLSLVLRSQDNPTTIFDNSFGSANGLFGITATTWTASKFCLGSQAYGLVSVSLLLNSQDSNGAVGPPCTVRLQIYSHNPLNGEPYTDTGVIMNLSGITNPITLLGGQQLVKWTPATPFSLLPNTCYWAVLSAEDGKRMAQFASFTPPTGDAGTLGQTRSGDAGATWLAPDTGSNFKMLIQGTAVQASPALVASAVRLSGNELRFSFPTRAGRTYAIESRIGLVSGVWTEVPGTLQTSVGDPFEVSLPIPQAQPQQFFRVKQLP